MTGQFGSNVATVASRVILNLEMRQMRHIKRFQQCLFHGAISPVLRKKEPVIFSFQRGSLNFYWRSSGQPVRNRTKRRNKIERLICVNSTLNLKIRESPSLVILGRATWLCSVFVIEAKNLS